MQTIEVVYSPLCEATGAMIGKLRHGLKERMFGSRYIHLIVARKG